MTISTENLQSMGQDIDFLNKKIVDLSFQLENHPVYQLIQTTTNLKIFMKSHVVAVWDFMSLLKRLQRDLTCVELPWFPKTQTTQWQTALDPRFVRLINEIVLGEESDKWFCSETNTTIGPIDHFSLYLSAMSEVGADCSTIDKLYQTRSWNHLQGIQKTFVDYHIQLATTGTIGEVAAAFFYGREKLIPVVFQSLLDRSVLNAQDCPSFVYYIKRHIQIDGEEHGHMAEECFDLLKLNHHQKILAMNAAIQSLSYRIELWNEVEQSILINN